MWKKGMAICATLIVGMMVLTGCSGGKDASTTQATTEQTTAATTVATTQATTAAKVQEGMKEVAFKAVKFNVPEKWTFVQGTEDMYYYYPEGSPEHFLMAQRQANIPTNIDLAKTKTLLLMV